MRLRWVGHEIHGEAVVEVGADLSLSAADAIVVAAEERLPDAVPRLTRAVVRARPRATTPGS